MSEGNSHDEPIAATTPPSAKYAVNRLREGTEVLRTGGGTTLTAAQCNALLDVIETARYLTKEPFGALNERSFYRLREALVGLE